MGESVVKGSLASLVSIATLAVYLILVPLLVFFLLKDKQEMLSMVRGVLPRNRKLATKVWDEMNQQISNYIRGKVLEMIVVGVATWIGFLIFGLPLLQFRAGSGPGGAGGDDRRLRHLLGHGRRPGLHPLTPSTATRATPRGGPLLCALPFAGKVETSPVTVLQPFETGSHARSPNQKETDMAPHLLTLFTRPEQAWQDIRAQETRNPLHYLGHLLLLALIPAISLYIGTTVVGWSLAENEVIRLDATSALQLCAGLYLAAVLGTLLMGAFVRWMARAFETRPGFNECVGFVAYTATPLFIAGLAALYPSRWLAVLVLGLAGAYASALLYLGTPVFMRLNREQAFLYASSIWGVGLLVLVNVLVTVILHWHLYLTPEYR